jgi:thiamine biosynthesis protein ThiI
LLFVFLIFVRFGALMTNSKKTAILLLSGGFDSPVAGFHANKEFDLIALHFSQRPFVDDSAEIKSLKLAKLLGLKEMLVCDAGEALKKMADDAYREYYFVLMKRLFVKVAEKVAQQKNAVAIITGESLGQVSSQTLSNLSTIENAVSIPIVRPLLFFQKQEIIDESKKLGFYETSIGKEMCDALAPGKPKTRTTLYKVEENEEKIGLKEIDFLLEKIRVEKC